MWPEEQGPQVHTTLSQQRSLWSVFLGDSASQLSEDTGFMAELHTDRGLSSLYILLKGTGLCVSV